ncbi:ComF family protein [Candidatus Peregrinibacteria bacterium]|nr:ComF family protein [Candidatus Peregrinibacteria bacterium]
MRLLTLILNTLFPPVCVSCKKEGDFLCIDCIRDFSKRKIRPYYTEYEDPDIHYLDGVIYGLDYARNPQIKVAVKQFKYRFTKELADVFADLIAERMGELAMTKGRQMILIPVPLHKKRLNERGFNQAEVIASAVTDRLPQVRVLPLLERVRYTSQQAKLDKKGRHENLEGAFIMNKKCVQGLSRAWGPYLVNRGVRKKGEKENLIKEKAEKKKIPLYFLVDDVFTTGATLENCARVLKENGFQKVYGLVVARALKNDKF